MVRDIILKDPMMELVELLKIKFTAKFWPGKDCSRTDLPPHPDTL
uniref:Uncharacterized protein n=1 Tax=Curvibacter symbiont subsp. Hydra magnipapillata TaxID=667019 RepID=C9YGM5_CURXX|nr:hypothetical protein Csp_B19250 [Curvibacter putative symbiont of Hydra magnipapillata]